MRGDGRWVSAGLICSSGTARPLSACFSDGGGRACGRETDCLRFGLRAAAAPTLRGIVQSPVVVDAGLSAGRDDACHKEAGAAGPAGYRSSGRIVVGGSCCAAA